MGLLGFLSCDSIATKETNATGDISERNQSHIALCRNTEPLEFKDILIGFQATWKWCANFEFLFNQTDINKCPKDTYILQDFGGGKKSDVCLFAL